MVDRGEPTVDLAGLVVPFAGRLVATGMGGSRTHPAITDLGMPASTRQA